MVIWTGWDIQNGKDLMIWFFDKKTGKLQFAGKFTFDTPITEAQAYLEAVRFQMVENGELPEECATKNIKEVILIIQQNLRHGRG